MSSLNLERADWASHAVDAFAKTTGAELWQEAVSDLICDLGHLCDAHDLNFVEIAAHSIGVWKIEQDQPDGVDLPYAVRIIISNPSRPSAPRTSGPKIAPPAATRGRR